MKCKTIGLVGPLLLCGSLSVHAATFQLSLTPSGIANFSDTLSKTGPFTDIYTFNVSGPADVVTTVLPIDFSSAFNISVATPQLFSVNSDGSSTVVAPSPGCTSIECNWDIAAAGSYFGYFLQIAGDVTGEKFPIGLQPVQYSGSIGAVSQAPLPAALPLFASGLGGMGLFAWWRKRKAAAMRA